MISTWWLFLIVPVAFMSGYALNCVFTIGKEYENSIEDKEEAN